MSEQFFLPFLLVLRSSLTHMPKWRFFKRGPKMPLILPCSPLILIDVLSPHSWLITGCLTRLIRRVPLVEQELLTLPEHLSSPRFLVGFVLRDLQFYVYVTVLLIFVCPFVRFLLAIVLSVLRYTDYDYPFGIFKLVLLEKFQIPIV